MHPAKNSEETIKDPKRMKYNCDESDLTTRVIKFKGKAESERIYQCQNCKLGFNSKDSFLNHMDTNKFLDTIKNSEELEKEFDERFVHRDIKDPSGSTDEINGSTNPDDIKQFINDNYVAKSEVDDKVIDKLKELNKNFSIPIGSQHKYNILEVLRKVYKLGSGREETEKDKGVIQAFYEDLKNGRINNIS